MTTENLTEEQLARSKLRQHFLKSIIDLQGQPCTITHYEKASLKAVFTAVNSDMQNILVTEFETPIAKYDSAMLRATDIISIKFDELYS